MRAAMVLLGALVASACGGASGDTGSVPLAELPWIDIEAVLAHTKELASDRYEGRAPGTPGEDLTVAYLEGQFHRMGLSPGAPDGSFVQPVPLVGITSAPAPLVVSAGDERFTFAWRDEVVASTRRPVERAAIHDSELVFVGYGIVAPEFGWDDYKGLDVRGKTLLVLVNDPPVRSPSSPSGLDMDMFGGPAMTYYGRWSYKFEIASEKGAAGVLLIHDIETAEYPFDVVQNSWTGEQLDLESSNGNTSRVAIEGWIVEDAARRLLKLAGRDLDALRRAAADPTFEAVPLGVHASMVLDNTLRTFVSRNVIAMLEGSDPDLRDTAVMYVAHWDHLGVGEPVDGDAVYNGARDNAVGIASMLEIARAFGRLEERPRRSIIFAAVTAEEQGLLGSRHYTENPTVPMARTVAAINIDTLNVHGRTKDFTLIGLGASDLDDYVRGALDEQQRSLIADPSPQTGSFYRSDHFNFARRGVPALYPDDGITFVDKPADFALKVRSEYVTRFYHRPADEVSAGWDLSGAAEDLQVLFAVGYRVAQSATAPEWSADSEFRPTREASLAAGE
jgi:Zn-dependent M28 family amino/carboxypeptidase